MYTFNSANNDIDFDIPVFKSLPAILRSDDNSDIVSNVELKKISIQDIYQLEPFNPSEEMKLHIAGLNSGRENSVKESNDLGIQMSMYSTMCGRRKSDVTCTSLGLDSFDSRLRSPMHYCTTKIFILLIIIIIFLYILFYWK